MDTTAIYQNRINDKNKIETELGFTEEGNNYTQFYIDDILFAEGYIRIVYGDHGPYIEFEENNIKVDLINLDGTEKKELPSFKNFKHYYVWLYPSNKIIKDIKVYWQVKSVKGLPNAPEREDGLPSKFFRQEGYADYKRGFYYVNPYHFKGVI